ncbi:mitochondrial carrier domain-containing protein [Tribonema minus]|uniref:Mitochondrial carrier domain-containing protein n=1 Tax=Tribonema minus TaxID=303371 RepID=A0A836CDP8_9STRA|nr:mitochondrial carrier domain-containing protein [Tribonema minus]
MQCFAPPRSIYSPILQPGNGRKKVLATSAAAGGAWDARLSHTPIHDNQYYLKCMLGGVLSCGLTHTAVTPLDVAKCNMQANPGEYKSLVQSIKKIMSEEGGNAIWKGWGPTAIGYSAQGCFKFGLYEYFKDFYSNLAGEENAYKYRGVIYLAGSASAEFFADIALCPMEMVKVKVQTSQPGTFPTGLGAAVAEMNARKVELKFPFGSVVPLWSRQIPYTMAKFYFFEKVVEFFYANVFTKPKSEYSKATQLGITFASGYTAGIICAIVSHPADTVVSKMGKGGKSAGEILSELGPRGVWGGLGTRVLMIGTLTGLQWWIYDTFKTVMGMGTTGGGAKK